MEQTRASRRRAARAARADATRRHALSPIRILLRVAFIPVLAAGIALSVYIRTSPFDRQDAVRHLVALAGCDAAAAVGVAPAVEGGLGYHARNDPDGDGIACAGAAGLSPRLAIAPAAAPPAAEPPRMQGGARFVRP